MREIFLVKIWLRIIDPFYVFSARNSQFVSQSKNQFYYILLNKMVLNVKNQIYKIITYRSKFSDNTSEKSQFYNDHVENIP